jgi:hypothetical protein
MYTGPPHPSLPLAPRPFSPATDHARPAAIIIARFFLSLGVRLDAKNSAEAEQQRTIPIASEFVADQYY